MFTTHCHVTPVRSALHGPGTGRVERRRRRYSFALAVISGLASFTMLAGDPAQAASGCDRWASSSGSDNADGASATRAFATLGTLAAALDRGQTGCIPAGDTFTAHGQGVIGATRSTSQQPITIRSGPGGRARIVGGVLLNDRAHDVVLADLDIVGDGFTGNALHVNGRSITLTGLDVQHPTGICIGVGTIAEFEQAYAGTEASAVTIRDSHVHGCGTDPSMQPRWVQDQFSGSHGIYIVNAKGTHIVGNVIEGNKYRGVQVYPRGTDTLVEWNLLHGNATQVNIGSSLSDGSPWRSRGTVVRNNVMSARVTDFRADKNPGQVHGYYPAGTPALGNLVEANCWVDEPGAEVTGNAIDVGANTFGVARFVDAGRGDFRQTPDSPCRDFGPDRLRPQDELRSEPAVSCSGGTASVALATDVRTASGTATWAYTRIFHRVNRGAWQHQQWFATFANTGSQQAWWSQVPGSSWARSDGVVHLTSNVGMVEVWEQRYELVDGAWKYEWHWAGSCDI